MRLSADQAMADQAMADQAMAELREIRCKTLRLRDYDSGRYCSTRIRAARGLVRRFEELSAKFDAYVHSEKPLNFIERDVVYELPQQAGNLLCEIFDRGLFDLPGFPKERNYADRRHLSAGWCEGQLHFLSEHIRSLDGPPPTDRRLMVSPIPERPSSELLQWLQHGVDIHAASTDDERARYDRFAVSCSWWAWIREQAECETHFIRLGTGVLEHWCFLPSKGLGSEPSGKRSTAVLPFRGNTSEECDRFRLQREAGIQATACRIAAERLMMCIEVEELGLLLQSMTPRRPEDDGGFIFRPDEDGYLISGFGQSAHVSIKAATGLHDIFRLIQSPNTPVEMLDLQFGGPVELLPGEKRSEQKMADAETVKRLKAEKARLRDEIESSENEVKNSRKGEIESAENVASRADAQRRLDEVTKEGRKMFDQNGRPRNMNDPWGAPRSAINKRLDKAYVAMATNGLPVLAANLKPKIKAKVDSYVYLPGDDPPEWHFSEKIEK